MFPRTTDHNLIAAGFIMIIAGALLLLQLIVEYVRKFASQLWLALIVISVAALMLALGIHFAHARDSGQWGNEESAIRDWYQNLMQPDVPNASCCGEADAYWCDDVHVRQEKTFCKITDDRPDAPRNRPHIDVGTEYEIPNNKLKWDRIESDRALYYFSESAGLCVLLCAGKRNLDLDKPTRPSKTRMAAVG